MQCKRELVHSRTQHQLLQIQAATSDTVSYSSDASSTGASSTKAISAEAPVITTSSRLLALPAELRDAIYTYAVIEPGEIRLTQGTCAEPALLRTCRQIREEAGSIFYEKNTISVAMQDYKLEPQTAHWYWTQPLKNGEIDFRGSPKWQNIKNWLRLHREGNVAGMDHLQEHESGQKMVVGQAWAILREMWDVDWSVTEKVLDIFRKGVDAKTSTWSFE